MAGQLVLPVGWGPLQKGLSPGQVRYPQPRAAAVRRGGESRDQGRSSVLLSARFRRHLLYLLPDSFGHTSQK